MPEAQDLGYRHMGEMMIDSLEERADTLLSHLTTEQLAEFWQGATEACALRLIRLKPEMVRRWPPE